MDAHGACVRKQPPRSQSEVADIFRAHGETYRANHVLTVEQRKAMKAIETCRTMVLGGHVDVCVDCGHERPSYNSCRNRHCPKCQALAQAKWLEKRRQRILPVHYFHVVFTLPSELQSLGLRSPRIMYDLLFRAASETLLTLGRDPKRYGALLGITAVMHTWTRDLRFHPHVHCIVTGGGLSVEGDRWVDSGAEYLFPVKVLGRLFRGKFLDALGRAHRRGRLSLPPKLSSPGAFARLQRQLFRKSWIVYAKRPFAGPEQVFSYLGRYTHRVGLSNHRLQEVTDEAITISTRNGKTATMPPEEFIRRFLLHILPRSFVKTRHYGLMASSNVGSRLKLAQSLLAKRNPPTGTADICDIHLAADAPKADWRSMLKRLTGIDLSLCSACGCPRIYRRVITEVADAAEGAAARAPPHREIDR